MIADAVLSGAEGPHGVYRGYELYDDVCRRGALRLRSGHRRRTFKPGLLRSHCACRRNHFDFGFGYGSHWAGVTNAQRS